jgi:hypothetical protein
LIAVLALKLLPAAAYWTDQLLTAIEEPVGLKISMKSF